MENVVGAREFRIVTIGTVGCSAWWFGNCRKLQWEWTLRWLVRNASSSFSFSLSRRILGSTTKSEARDLVLLQIPNAHRQKAFPLLSNSTCTWQGKTRLIFPSRYDSQFCACSFIFFFFPKFIRFLANVTVKPVEHWVESWPASVCSGAESIVSVRLADRRTFLPR